MVRTAPRISDADWTQGYWQQSGGLLKGRSFDSARRHGENLFVGLGDGGWMLLRFGTTGRLAYFKNPDDEPTHAEEEYEIRHHDYVIEIP
jgi:hypothetical protein